MPRTNNPKEYVRAYHRATAVLRERYLDEWNQIRAEILSGLLKDPNSGSLPPGPKKGQGVARGRHERRIRNYDTLARENQALKDALAVSDSYLRDISKILKEHLVWPEQNELDEQLRINEQLIEETKTL